MGLDLQFKKDIKTNYSGDLILINRRDALRQSILLRLSTRKGSNVFHPEYGNDVYSILSDNITDSWINRAKNYIKECVEQDKRVTVLDIKFEIEDEKGRVRFYVKYCLEGEEIDSLIWSEKFEKFR